MAAHLAPALQVSRWFNTQNPISLEMLRGRVVVLHAFQMLCPACVSNGIPQAARVHRHFPSTDLAVVGLHTVFEHHGVMGEGALRVFLHEYHVPFPVGMDQAVDDQPVPLTMRTYGLRGTPSLVLLDRRGRLRLSHFGLIDDLVLGAEIGLLIGEPAGVLSDPALPAHPLPWLGDPACTGDACIAPGRPR